LGQRWLANGQPAPTSHIRVCLSDTARYSCKEIIMMHPLGIDVSKAKLDVALLKADGKYRCKVFANDAAGFASLLLWLRSHVPNDHADVHVCLEATGSYHEALALCLTDQAVSVLVVNPLLVKRFMEVERVRNKTDVGDAKDLARYCRAT
jgi:transposase